MWSAEEIKKEFKGCSTSRPIMDMEKRKNKCDTLFNKNKVSDEYYTTKISWKRYLETRGLLGCEAFEPFTGDGMPLKELGQLVQLQTFDATWNFFDKIDLPECPKSIILTNPPFSFKYHVIMTLLERKRNFAMIVPFQVFIRDRTKIFDKYEKKYGGKWRWFKLKGKEKDFECPIKNKDGKYKTKAVGVHILEWDFDNKYQGDREIM